MRRSIACAALGGCVLLCAGARGIQAEPASVIQALIDSAASGDAISLPEGRFEGQIVLREGVAIVGAESGKTVIDGTGLGAVVSGARESIVSGVAIVGGEAGIDTQGYFMGIFDCEIRGERNIGIHVSGGSAVIVNNLIEGGALRCNSSCPTIVCNTIVSKCEDGIWAWYAPGPRAIDNLIVGAAFGIRAGAGSVPSLRNNALWGNVKDYDGVEADGAALTVDPLFANPDGGDYRLGESSPLVSAGSPVEGLWAGERPDVGRNWGRGVDLGECRAMMAAVAAELVRNGATVTYTLGEEPGAVLVTVRDSRRSFTVHSSTDRTAICDIEAFDEMGGEALEAELIGDAFPGVSVKAASAVAAVRGDTSEGALSNSLDNRYVLRNVYRSAESYYDDGDIRIFRRKTNLPRAIVEIPDGYTPVYILNNRAAVEISDTIEFAAPGAKEMEIGLKKTK